jgi:hypothetical protein
MAEPSRGARNAGAWMIEPYADETTPARLARARINPTAVRPPSPNALKDWPYVGHTSGPESFIPIYAPIRDGIAYYQDGDYGSAAVSGAEALLDTAGMATGLGAAVLARKAAQKGVRMALLKPTFNQSRRDLAVKAGLVPKNYEVHHIIARDGMKYSVPAFRNHPAFLKPLPEATHQRLTRSWQGQPKLGLPQRLWHGSNLWMKAATVEGAAVGSRTLPRTRANRDDDQY